MAELDLPPVPTILRALERGRLMLPDICMFLAGLYIGLGGLGIESTKPVSRKGRMVPLGMTRGPEGLENEDFDVLGGKDSKEE